MKTNAIIIGVAELALIGIMGICGTLALTHAGAYAWLHDLIAPSHPAIGHYLPAIIWGVIFAFGFQSVILRRKGGGALTWLVIIISLPSFLSFNTLDWLEIIGVELKITTELSFYQALGLGALIMICYVLLNSMSISKQFRRSLIKRKATPQDIEKVHTKGHSFLLLASGAALVAAAIVAVLARVIESLTSTYIPRVPWYTISIGLGCILILRWSPKTRQVVKVEFCS